MSTCSRRSGKGREHANATHPQQRQVHSATPHSSSDYGATQIPTLGSQPPVNPPTNPPATSSSRTPSKCLRSMARRSTRPLHPPDPPPPPPAGPITVLHEMTSNPSYASDAAGGHTCHGVRYNTSHVPLSPVCNAAAEHGRRALPLSVRRSGRARTAVCCIAAPWTYPTTLRNVVHHAAT